MTKTTRQVRLGYACINLTLGSDGSTSRTCRLSKSSPKRLEELSRENLRRLLRILQWNASNRISVFRISSGIIPLASHPKAQWPWKQRLHGEILSVGDFARKHRMRLSMHPGQYTVLNSPREDVVAAAFAELSYHAAFMDAMGLGSDSRIVLHVGGVYGYKGTSMRRFRESFEHLPANVQRRLVLENDERSYGVDDVLDLCRSLQIPLVFDYLHHTAYTGHEPDTATLRGVFKTWKESDGRPKLHYSTQRRGGCKGAHADMIDAKDFLHFLNFLPGGNADVMLEAKAKDKALLKLRRDLHGR